MWSFNAFATLIAVPYHERWSGAQESLRKARRELKVEVGSIAQPGPDSGTPSTNPSDPDGDEMLRSIMLLHQREQFAQAVGAASSPKAASPPGQPAPQPNSFLQRYFQVPPPSSYLSPLPRPHVSQAPPPPPPPMGTLQEMAPCGANSMHFLLPVVPRRF